MPQILARRVVVIDLRLLGFHGIGLSLSHAELEESSLTRLRRLRKTPFTTPILNQQ